MKLLSEITEFDVSPYYDERGFPGTIDYNANFDGGDTAAIVGNFRAFGYLMEPVVNVDTHTGTMEPLRHWNPNRWWGRPGRFSRDQLVATLCGLVMYPAGLNVEHLWKAHKKNWFVRAWNTIGNGEEKTEIKSRDWTGPEVWALWIRMWRLPYAWLFLWALDLELLVGAVIWRWFRDDSRVTRNHMLSSIVCYKVMPTWVSRLAFRINDWPDLIERWRLHCAAVCDPPTDILFKAEIKRIQGG